MGMDTTITEQDLDPSSSQFVKGFRKDDGDFEPDLAVDGLSESIVGRIVRLLTFSKS